MLFKKGGFVAIMSAGECRYFDPRKPLVAKLVARGAVKPLAAEGVYAVQVPQYHVAILYVDGKVHTLLEAGLHHYWKWNRDLKADLVDTRLLVLDVAGQEILTRDK